MQRWRFVGSSVLGGAALCLSLSACATQHDRNSQLADQLARARSDAAWHEARASEFEARLTQLERRVQVNPGNRAPGDQELLKRLDYLIALNERLLSGRSYRLLNVRNVGGSGRNVTRSSPRRLPTTKLT